MTFKKSYMANRKVKSDNYRIENEKDYNATMKKIDALMKKGEKKLTNKEAEELRTLALAAQAYEKSIYTITPGSFPGRFYGDFWQTDRSERGAAHVVPYVLHRYHPLLSLPLPGRHQAYFF